MNMTEAEIHLREMRGEVANVLQMLDELAELWGDEGKFRACRDRLRKLLHIQPYEVAAMVQQTVDYRSRIDESKAIVQEAILDSSLPPCCWAPARLADKVVSLLDRTDWDSQSLKWTDDAQELLDECRKLIEAPDGH